MSSYVFIPRLFCFVSIVIGSGVVNSQAYPNKPIRIVTGAAGGASDFGARILAQGITAPLGQQVIVDNRGAGVIPPEIVSRAPSDGYTLLFSGSTMWLAPYLKDKVTFDPIKDFRPATWASSASNVLVVHPAVAASSVKDLIALAKAQPGALNYAAAGDGGSAHLAAELFKAMAGVNVVYVPYKSAASAHNDLIGGQVQMMFGTVGTLRAHINAGRLRALATSGTTPSTLFPGLPTIAASGLPGYESVAILGVFAPAQTPTTIIHRLNEEMVRVLHRPDVKEKVASIGVETVGSSPEVFATTVKSEMARMSKVIKDAGIRAE